MSSTRRSRSFFLALFVCALLSVPCSAETPKPAPPSPEGVASDGTVTGALTVNGEKFALTHVYGRKREAWPADAKALGLDSVDELSCGIVDLIFANTALSEATITSILQNEYRGSETIRGVRFVIDGAGQKWEKMFLLDSGAVVGYGVTQTNGEIEGGGRFKGKMACKNEEVTQVRMFDISFDTGVKVQYSRTETETSERIPESRLTQEFLKALPGEWKIVRWVGLSCTTASGRLVVGERSSPRAFQGTFYITLSSGEEVEEEGIISLSGTKVHFESVRVNVPETVWRRDDLDLELWQDLMVANTEMDYVVLRKKP